MDIWASVSEGGLSEPSHVQSKVMTELPLLDTEESGITQSQQLISCNATEQVTGLGKNY